MPIPSFLNPWFFPQIPPNGDPVSAAMHAAIRDRKPPRQTQPPAIQRRGVIVAELDIPPLYAIDVQGNSILHRTLQKLIENISRTEEILTSVKRLIPSTPIITPQNTYEEILHEIQSVLMGMEEQMDNPKPIDGVIKDPNILRKEALNKIQLIINQTSQSARDSMDQDTDSVIDQIDTSIKALNLTTDLSALTNEALNQMKKIIDGIRDPYKRQQLVNLPNLNGQTPLHLAAVANAPNILSELITVYQANIDAQDSVGETAVHLIVKWGNAGKSSLDHLLKRKPNLNLYNHEGMLPIHLAAQRWAHQLMPKLYEETAKELKIWEPTLANPDELNETPVFNGPHFGAFKPNFMLMNKANCQFYTRLISTKDIQEWVSKASYSSRYALITIASPKLSSQLVNAKAFDNFFDSLKTKDERIIEVACLNEKFWKKLQDPHEKNRLIMLSQSQPVAVITILEHWKPDQSYLEAMATHYHAATQEPEAIKQAVAAYRACWNVLKLQKPLPHKYYTQEINKLEDDDKRKLLLNAAQYKAESIFNHLSHLLKEAKGIKHFTQQELSLLLSFALLVKSPDISLTQLLYQSITDASQLARYLPRYLRRIATQLSKETIKDIMENHPYQLEPPHRLLSKKCYQSYLKLKDINQSGGEFLKAVIEDSLALLVAVSMPQFKDIFTDHGTIKQILETVLQGKCKQEIGGFNTDKLVLSILRKSMLCSSVKESERINFLEKILPEAKITLAIGQLPQVSLWLLQHGLYSMWPTRITHFEEYISADYLERLAMQASSQIIDEATRDKMPIEYIATSIRKQIDAQETLQFVKFASEQRSILPDSTGKTLLHLMIETAYPHDSIWEQPYGNPSTWFLGLLKQDQTLLTQYDTWGNNPIHSAAGRGGVAIEIIEAMTSTLDQYQYIECFVAACQQMNCNGKQPLEIALELGNWEMAARLMPYTKNSEAICQNRYLSPFKEYYDAFKELMAILNSSNEWSDKVSSLLAVVKQSSIARQVVLDITRLREYLFKGLRSHPDYAKYFEPTQNNLPPVEPYQVLQALSSTTEMVNAPRLR